MAASSSNVLFLTTPGVGSAPVAGFSDKFFDAIQGAGIGVTKHEVFGPMYELNPSAYAAALSGASRDTAAVVSFGPLSPTAVKSLKANLPSSKIVAVLDRPSEFGAFEPLVENSDAVIAAHRTFGDFIPSHNRCGDAHNRFKEIVERGLLFTVLPGIDLERYNPAADSALICRGSKFCAEYPQSKEGTIGPSGKRGNYDFLRTALNLDADRDAENVAVYADDLAKRESDFMRAFGRLPQNIAIVFFGTGDSPSDCVTRLVKLLRQRSSSKKFGYVGFFDDKKFRVLLAGSGYAVFFGNRASFDYPDPATVRSMLLFMRYGAMPIVPNVYDGLKIAETCVLDRKYERDVWLYPTGFAFPHDGSDESIKDAISGASMHDFRTCIGHGVFSGAVPNAMKAAAGHDISKEAAAYAEVIRKVVSR